MRLLIVTSHFYPENFKCNDMAFELKRRGHDVTVLAPIPDYPQGRFYDGYGVFKKRSELVGSVKVIRTLVIPRRDGSAKWLVLNYLSHTFFSSCFSLWLGLTKKYDAVIVHETSPVTIAISAVIVKKIQKIPLFFWVLDLWPESLSAAGGIRNKKILGFFAKLTAWLYRNSDRILIGSKGYRKSIGNMGDFDSKMVFFPNWVDESLSKKISTIEIPTFPKGFNVLFAGNIGDAQDFPHTLEAAELLRDKNINFIFVGDGRKKEWVENRIAERKLRNVYCLGRFPLETMPRFFEQADVLYLALKDIPIFGLTVPAKLQAYMSSGKPIVAMINGEGAHTIDEANCGWSVPAENPKALAGLLLTLSKLPEAELTGKGARGKSYSERFYDFKNCMDHLEEIIHTGIRHANEGK